MAQFYKVAKLSELSADCGLSVEVEGVELGLFLVGKEVRALDAACPHRNGPLADGEVDGDVVICPWHGWEFDLRTGACLTDPSSRVRTYEVRVEGNDVLVCVSPASE